MSTTPLPKVIGGFEILSKIGAGGMGAVFKARQVSMDRVVALKLLPPKIANADPVFVERFIREARASARLNHPHIVQGIDVGKDEASGLYYFAMEYIDGPSVMKLLKQKGTLPEQQSLRIISDVAEALACAHRAGIVHRDVKPDNILIDSSGSAKLADLGLAKRVEAYAADITHSLPAIGPGSGANLTQTGSTVGTPNYMSPEQAEGRAKQVDIRSDLYSLGATLYHMLIGKPPYEGASSVQIVVRHITEPVPDARRANSRVSEPVSRLISRLMQKKQEHRFQTPQELSAELKRILTTIPSAATLETRKSTTGPRQPIRGDTTHNPGVSRGPARRAVRALGESPRAGAGALAWAGVGGALLLVALLILMGGRSPSGPENARKREVRPETAPTPAVPIVEAPKSVGVQDAPSLPAPGRVVPGTVDPAKEPLPAAAQAPVEEAWEATAREEWKEPLERLDLPAAREALERWVNASQRSPRDQVRARELLDQALLARTEQLRSEVAAKISSGSRDGIQTRLEAVRLPPEGGSWAAAEKVRQVLGELRRGLDPSLTHTLPAGSAEEARLWFAQLEEQYATGNLAGVGDFLQASLKKYRETPLSAAIKLQQQALESIRSYERAVAAGASKLVADQKANEALRYALLFVEGEPYEVGAKAPFRALSMANDSLEISPASSAKTQGSGSFSKPLRKLTRSTRRALALDPVSADPRKSVEIGLQAALADLVSWRTYKGTDKADWTEIEQAIERARQEEAHSGSVAAALAWKAYFDQLGAKLPKEWTLDLGAGVKLELILIPAGSFVQGTPEEVVSPEGYPPTPKQLEEERPARKMQIGRPFYLGRFEVTQAQFERVMKRNPSYPKHRAPDRPVDSVTLADAREFCEQAGKATGYQVDLPTETQWEYACKAGTAEAVYLRWDPKRGEEVKNWAVRNQQALAEVGWFEANSGLETKPVGQKKANPWGLHDMQGNVMEWCSSVYERYAPQEAGKTEGPAGPRRYVARGGNAGRPFGRCRAESRFGVPEGEGPENLRLMGLRVCLPTGRESGPQPR